MINYYILTKGMINYHNTADVTIHIAEMKLDTLQVASETIPLTSYLYFLLN